MELCISLRRCAMPASILAALCLVMMSAWATRDAPTTARSKVMSSYMVGLPLDDLATTPSLNVCGPCTCINDYVNCSNRGLRKFSEVPQIASARKLNLCNNYFEEIPAGAFQSFTQLGHLLLCGNSIREISVSAFRGLNNLTLLDLHQNILNISVLTAEMLSPLEQLKVLKLNNNSRASVYPDQAFAVLRSLEELHLDAVGTLVLGSGFLQISGLETLSFSGRTGFCTVPVIRNATFGHVHRLRKLFLIECNISYIEPLAFQPLRDLDTLDISNNRQLGFRNLSIASYGLQGSKIRVLKINFIYPRYATCVNILKCHLQFLHNTSLEEIQIDGNNIELFQKGTLCLTPRSLKTVSARFNSFTYGSYMYELDQLRNLTSLDLSMTGKVHTLPHVLSDEIEDITCVNECPPSSLTQASAAIGVRAPSPSIDRRSMEVHSSDGSAFSIPVPPNLRRIGLQWCELFYYLTAVNMSANDIEVLDLSDNVFPRWIGPIQGFNKLRHLNLSHNHAGWLKKDFFQNMTALIDLNISHNHLSGIMAGRSIQKPFEYLGFLQVLDVSFDDLYGVSEDTFSGLHSLEKLYASNNKITAEHFYAELRYLEKLNYLDLSRNDFNWLPERVTTALDDLNSKSQQPIGLDLSRNPMSCSCGNKKFLRWIQETKVKILNRQHFFCLFTDGTTGSFWDNLERIEDGCENYWMLALGSFLAVIVFIGSTVGVIVYRNRWKLRYMYYGAKTAHRRVDDRVFQYDAFISYDSEDADFVVNDFCSKMEEQGLRICIHDVHFTPGKSIISNILEAIQVSRRTVCILSQHFLKSYWCMYEMQMAMQEGVQSGRDVVLLVIYDPRCKYAQSLPREVLFYIKSDTYIEYPNEPSYAPCFWNNLVRALKGN